MKPPTRRIGRLLAVLVCLAWVSCSVTENSGRDIAAAALDDGVYPVVSRDQARAADPEPGGAGRIVELESLPVNGSADAEPETILIYARPVLRFRELSRHEFKVNEKNECTEVHLQNTDELKEFTRKHVGSRLAMVIGGKVITHHKIREPIETDEVMITFCTEGAGDHLRTHLTTVLPEPGR